MLNPRRTVLLPIALGIVAFVLPVSRDSAPLSATPEGSRPRNLAVTSDGEVALTTSMGSNSVIQLIRSGSTWTRDAEIPVGGKSWGIAIFHYMGNEFAVVSLPHQDHLAVLMRDTSGDFVNLLTIPSHYFNTEVLVNAAGDRIYVCNRGAAPESAEFPSAVAVEDWQNAVYEYTFPYGALARTFVTDREPRALALSPDEERLFVGHVQGALGQPSNDATASGGSPVPDAANGVSFPDYDGGSIIAFDLTSSAGSPDWRILIGSPVRGLAVLDLGDTYRLFATHVGFGVNAEDPNFGGRRIPNVISNFEIRASDHTTQSRQDVYVQHSPGSSHDDDINNLSAVLHEKLAIRETENERELWVTNSGSGSVTRLTMDHDTGILDTSGSLHLNFKQINPVNPRTANGWILAGKIIDASIDLDQADGDTTVDVGASSDSALIFTSNPRGIVYSDSLDRVLTVTRFDQELVEINPGTFAVSRTNLTDGSPLDYVHVPERNFFTFGRGFEFREFGPQPRGGSQEATVNNITCGTCHVDGHLDGKIRLITNNIFNRNNNAGTIGPFVGTSNERAKPVQVPTIFDIGSTEWIFFEGKRTIRDREQPVLPVPPGFGSCGYCVLTGFFRDTRDFTDNLSSPISPHAPLGYLNAQQVRGRFLFEAMNCSRCHSGPLGSTFLRTKIPAGLLPEGNPQGPLPPALADHNPFLHDPTQVFIDSVLEASNRNMTDVGTRLVSGGSPEGQANGINTPALAGVWDNRPYMHDGRYRTLRQVLENTWLVVGDDNRTASLVQDGIPDNAFNADFPENAGEIESGVSNPLFQFKVHKQYPSGTEPDSTDKTTVIAYLNSISGSRLSDPVGDLLAFLGAVSSQTELCGANADAPGLITDLAATADGDSTLLSWSTTVPVACDVLWGPSCNPTTADSSAQGFDHSLVLPTGPGGADFLARVTARMRTVCGEDAFVDFTWETTTGGDSIVTADSRALLCPTGSADSMSVDTLLVTIDLPDTLSGPVAADRFSLCSGAGSGLIVFGDVQADSAAQGPDFRTTMTVLDVGGCSGADSMTAFTVLLDGSTVLGTARVDVKTPDLVAPYGWVNMSDFDAFVEAYGSSPDSANYNPCANLDHVGKIGLLDLTLFANHLGHMAPGLLSAPSAGESSVPVSIVAAEDPSGGTLTFRTEGASQFSSILAVVRVEGTPTRVPSPAGRSEPRFHSLVEPVPGSTDGRIILAAWNLDGEDRITLGAVRLGGPGSPGTAVSRPGIHLESGWALNSRGETVALGSLHFGEPVDAGGNLIYALRQNVPNPVRSSTAITFSIPEAGRATLEIFNIQGRKVRVLVDDAVEASRFTATWDGLDDRGERAAAGVYFYRLQAGDFQQTKKLVLLR